MSSERQYACDVLAKTFAKVTNFDNENDPDAIFSDHNKIQEALNAKCGRDHRGAFWEPIPEDNPIMIQLRSMKLNHSGKDVITGYYKHPKFDNRYIYVGVGYEMGYRTNFMFGKSVYYQWMVTNKNLPVSGMVTFWLYTGTETEVCVDKPQLSLFAISRLVIWKNRFLRDFYSPVTGKGYQHARTDFITSL
jgi:hypothetical protein